jgi:hypothetical protein
MQWFTIAALGALSVATSSLGAQPAETRVTGTYRLVVCKGAPCSPSDTTRSIASGTVVLADSALPLASLPDSARHLLRPSYLRGEANGCYAYAPARPAQTYAGISRAAATHWERDSTGTPGTIVFTLYASPDARHMVRAVVVGDTLRGVGESSGAGVAEVHYPNDAIVAVRVGPANIAPCVIASAREWRRLQQLFRIGGQRVQGGIPARRPRSRVL